jgi:hypothetical protein
MKLEIFSTKLEITRSWHLNNINTKLEIFSTRLASQQHQHETGNLQHEVASQQHQHEAGNLQQKAGITTTSTPSWKSSAQGWHHNTTPPFEGGPFGLYQACLESA